MKTLEVEVPDQLAAEIAEFVANGWFASEAEIARQALIDFTRRRRLQLQENFQRQDIRRR